MGKFRQFLTALSAHKTSVFSFPDDNLSKYQWIFTKLGMCIDIVEICCGVADGQISSIFDRIICPPLEVVWYYRFTLLFSLAHYENTPIQIYRKFHLQKLKLFR